MQSLSIKYGLLNAVKLAENCIMTRDLGSFCRIHVQRKPVKMVRNPCKWSEERGKPTTHLETQMIFPRDFFLPFGGKLDKENRWVQLAQLVPWAEAEKKYDEFFKDGFRDQHTISLRKALGALIIQERT
jgi:hypothetical protein